MLTNALLAELAAIVGDEHLLSEERTLLQQSKDFYWFSPVLKPLLEDKRADVMVRPGNVDELLAVVRLAVRERIPITARGAGTGNYGQGIPIHGGILLNLKRLDQILEITEDAMRVQAGTLLVDMEQAARQRGLELRFFPSTLQTATAGGFVSGGAGGIGSVTWGTLWDDDNVRAATVVTVEEDPQILSIDSADGLRGVVHNCGLTAIVLDCTLALAPARPWAQYVVAFDTFTDALRCAEELAIDDSEPKRLVTALAWPIPSYFRQLVKDGACPDGKANLLLQVVMDEATLAARMASFGGVVTWHSLHENYLRRGWQLSDFSWNHTTLWAMKSDPSLTYLQDMFLPDKVYQQLAQRRERYGDVLMEHIEFMKFGGRLVPQGLTLVRFQSSEQLTELMSWCESIGIWIANAHTHYLDEDVRWNGQPILDARARWDPHGLLNPGHLKGTGD
ncbi:MAG: FAD-binding oxidoreductase [Caldilineaceae bacterium]|nr:FAD-binding oxidoreductase [Caldilineaceae bacterium]